MPQTNHKSPSGHLRSRFNQRQAGRREPRKCTSCPHRFLTVEKVAEVEDYETWIEGGN